MPVNILHLHSSFALGGAQARAARLMNAWGARARHTIVSAIPDELAARTRIDAGVDYEIAQNPPALTGKPSVARYEAIAKLMRRFDLVLTYDWGAIDGVMARRVFAKGQPPVIHHEDGAITDEALGLKRERSLYRRLALSSAQAVAVASATLEHTALDVWKQPRARVHRIANGVSTARYAGKPDLRALPGFTPDTKQLVIGAVARLIAAEDLPMLVRAAGGVSRRIKLVIVGEGPERATIAQAAAAMGMADQLLMPGHLDRPNRYLGLFDLFALSSVSEHFPLTVVEAMAAGLPVAAPALGDLAPMVSAENAPFITAERGAVFLRDAIEALAADPALRRRVGEANRRKARAEYDEGAMIERYARLYESALRTPGVLLP